MTITMTVEGEGFRMAGFKGIIRRKVDYEFDLCAGETLVIKVVNADETKAVLIDQFMGPTR